MNTNITLCNLLFIDSECSVNTTIEPLGAVRGDYITGDVLLSNVDTQAIGIFGLGIGSDLWWGTSTILIDSLTNTSQF